MDRCTQALDCGLQPIPESILSKTYLSSDKQTAQSLIDVLNGKCSFQTEDDLTAALLPSASLTTGNQNKTKQNKIYTLYLIKNKLNLKHGA